MPCDMWRRNVRHPTGMIEASIVGHGSLPTEAFLLGTSCLRVDCVFSDLYPVPPHPLSSKVFRKKRISAVMGPPRNYGVTYHKMKKLWYVCRLNKYFVFVDHRHRESALFFFRFSHLDCRVVALADPVHQVALSRSGTVAERVMAHLHFSVNRTGKKTKKRLISAKENPRDKNKSRDRKLPRGTENPLKKETNDDERQQEKYTSNNASTNHDRCRSRHACSSRI